jgi:hypothetical protein
MPPKRHADQAAPAPLGPTGRPIRNGGRSVDPRSQAGDYLTRVFVFRTPIIP